MSKHRGGTRERGEKKAGKSKIYRCMLSLGLFESMYVFV